MESKFTRCHILQAELEFFSVNCNKSLVILFVINTLIRILVLYKLGIDSCSLYFKYLTERLIFYNNQNTYFKISSYDLKTSTNTKSQHVTLHFRHIFLRLSFPNYLCVKLTFAISDSFDLRFIIKLVSEVMLLITILSVNVILPDRSLTLHV